MLTKDNSNITHIKTIIVSDKYLILEQNALEHTFSTKNSGAKASNIFQLASDLNLSATVQSLTGPTASPAAWLTSLPSPPSSRYQCYKTF